jgi:hypothetical protein
MSGPARVLILELLLAAIGGAFALGVAQAQSGEDHANATARPPDVSFDVADGTVAIKVGADVVGAYAFKDPVTTRPHFRNLHAPGGALVTRAHPPVEGRDPTDHADMHPGAWLAFADVGGLDVWRNKARVEHVRFVDDPKGDPGRGTFAVVNRYLDDVRPVCEETCRYTLLVRPAGYLLIADSTFRPVEGGGGGELSFGDQEEMGFGVRVATPIAVKAGGRILDDEGRLNEAQIWGKTAKWVDYSGPAADQGRAGVMLIPDPANPHASRFHVRDYGLMVANPFGRKVFGEPEAPRVVIPAGGEYGMRFAVLLHAEPADREPDLQSAYDDCLKHFAEPAPAR